MGRSPSQNHSSRVKRRRHPVRITLPPIRMEPEIRGLLDHRPLKTGAPNFQVACELVGGYPLLNLANLHRFHCSSPVSSDSKPTEEVGKSRRRPHGQQGHIEAAIGLDVFRVCAFGNLPLTPPESLAQNPVLKWVDPQPGAIFGWERPFNLHLPRF